MAKQPGQLGQNAIWDGPLQPSNLVPGDSRYGMDPIQVLKADTPYKPGPITTKSYKNRISSGIDLGIKPIQ